MPQIRRPSSFGATELRAVNQGATAALSAAMCLRRMLPLAILSAPRQVVVSQTLARDPLVIRFPRRRQRNQPIEGSPFTTVWCSEENAAIAESRGLGLPRAGGVASLVCHDPPLLSDTIAVLMVKWTSRFGLDRNAVINATRTAVATVLSLLLARSVLKLSEFYWAPISTIVILLSTINPLTLAWQRFAGTALGATLGALIATFFHANWMVYGVGIFVCGILSAVLRLGSAHRFAAIALSIVLLVAHGQPPWIVALHRFFEVSLGISVALMVTSVWPLPANRTS
ncbi:MAG: hypothetical protein DMG97_01490 [Acidobacteria bacterium]|nr:MAG: hypothetical protein DMG97_01490 [Acidobacteriota bacterium]